MDRDIIIAMTGASGQIYGVRALELLAETDLTVHLVMSDSAKVTIEQELDRPVADVRDLGDHVYSNDNVGAPPASGSFRNAGVLVSPCSMKTLANVARGNSRNLIARSADVALKERRPLVLMPREKPLNRIHLKNMLEVTDAGGIVVPPFLSFYQETNDLDRMISRTMARALDQFDVSIEYSEWDGL